MKTKNLDSIVDRVLYHFPTKREGRDLYLKIGGQWIPTVDWMDGPKQLQPEDVRKIARLCYSEGKKDGLTKTQK